MDVLPSDPRTTPPIGAVSKEEPYDGALDAGAGTAAIGSSTSGEKPSIYLTINIRPEELLYLSDPSRTTPFAWLKPSPRQLARVDL